MARTADLDLDLPALTLDLAVMSATVGTIVVVVIVFAAQEQAAKRAQRRENPPFAYRWHRELGRIELLLSTATVAMAGLLLTSVFLLLGLLARPLRIGWVLAAGSGMFAFSVCCLLFGFVAYLAVDRSAPAGSEEPA